jgi:hypothetical protein
MQPKVRNLIIILLILLLLLSGAIWWYVSHQKKIIPVVQTPVTTSTPTIEQIALDTKVQENLATQIVGKTDQEVSDYSAILNVSRFFVERYGSFSTGALWQNIYDVKSVVTSDLWTDLEKLTKQGESTSQLSLSTKVLSLNLVSQDATKAQVITKTQKNEIKGTESRIFYQDITLELIKQADTWLVTDFNMGQEKK